MIKYWKIQIRKNLKEINDEVDIVVGNIATPEAAKFLLDAGADGIMIHSRRKNPSEIFEFCKFYNKFKALKYFRNNNGN